MAPLNVIIVGGGIAGSICARVLREHHNVTIIERSNHEHAYGNGVNLGPNATKILDKLGFSTERAQSITLERYRIIDSSGALREDYDLRPYQEISGGRWYSQQWADMWHEFRRLALAPSEELGISGRPATMIMGIKVVNVDVEKGEVFLEDGNKLEGDLIIGADGIRSVLRSIVLGDKRDMSSTEEIGMVAFRFIIPAEYVEEVAGKLRVMDPERPPCLDHYLALDGSKRKIVMYPCRNFKLLNAICMAPKLLVSGTAGEPWGMLGDGNHLADCFSDFGEPCQAILRNVKEMKLYPMSDLLPLPSYVRGRAILVGDAAHTLSPHQDQASSQAIEDAEAFELFNKDVDRSQIQDILKDIDRIRRPRAASIQETTRAALIDPKESADPMRYLFYWTYPGIRQCLKNMDEGRQMMEI